MSKLACAVERFEEGCRAERAKEGIIAKAPEHIMKLLRQRRGLEENDRAMDADLHKLSANEKLREVAAWELGDPSWADQFMTWAKACGIKVEGGD